MCKLPFGLSGSGRFQESSLRIRNQAEAISYICGFRNIPVIPGTPVSSFACVIGDHHCFGDRAAVLSDFEISGIDRKKRRVSFNQMIPVTLNRECNSPDPCCKIFVRKWLLWSVRAFERSYGIAFSLFWGFRFLWALYWYRDYDISKGWAADFFSFRIYTTIRVLLSKLRRDLQYVTLLMVG